MTNDYESQAIEEFSFLIFCGLDSIIKKLGCNLLCYTTLNLSESDTRHTDKDRGIGKIEWHPCRTLQNAVSRSESV